MTTRSKFAASTKQSKVVDPWIDALDAISINDQHWSCMVVMLIETLPEHTTCVELFNEAAEKGARKAIYPLTFKKMINNIKNLSKVDQDKCPVLQGVMHHANEVISRNDVLDAWLVAKVVKYIVHRAKIETITREEKETNQGNEIDHELRAMLTVGKMESQRSMKSSKSKKSAQAVETKPPEKSTTRLRKFGEEWRDKVYVDDAPKGGPDLYVILTGFRDPALPLELIKVGVPLTCILKIKRPHEMLDDIEDNQSDVVNSHDDSPNVTKKSFSRSDVVKMLSHFWSTLNKSSNNPENFDEFSSIIFRTFCPPEIPTNNHDEEVERFGKDLYDRISCIVYDLYDLQCLHVDYIESMKIENVPTDISNDREFSVYASIMDAVPAECACVEVLLQAMLAQVEIDFLNDETFMTSTMKSQSERPARFKSNVESVHGERLAYPESSRSSIHSGIPQDQINSYETKLNNLNIQYNIGLKDKQLLAQEQKLEIILEDDKFRLKTYHVRLDDDVMKLVDPKPESLADLAMRSLRDPRVIDLWKFREDISKTSKKKNNFHLKKLTRFFDGSVDSGSVVHYLHLRVFDKMIHGNLNRTAATRCEDYENSITRKGCSPSAKRSDPFPLSAKTVLGDPTLALGENPISNLRGFESDSIIDHGRNICDIFECPELFAFTDARETLRPGFRETEKEKVFETQAAGPSVAEFTDVRILSKNVFLQMVHDCLREFKDFRTRYVDTTDSVLLYFGEKEGSTEPNDFRNSRVCKIVTPVCLRNFCEYVINEEHEWIREMEMDRSNTGPVDVGELSRKLSQHSDIDTVKLGTFTDDDFVLPNSLKGQSRQNYQERLSDGIEATEKIWKKGDKPTGKIETVPEDVKAKKKKIVPKNSFEKTSKDIKAVDNESSSVPTSKVPTVKCARRGFPRKFIGYNVGNRRVQLTTHSETFSSADGTLVEVIRDEWLYRIKSLGIGIHLSGCFLKLERTIGERHDDRIPFHLITGNGIVMAFANRQQLKESSTSKLNQNCDLKFDFCASWPSGLTIKLVRDDGSENSFHILQRYISKGPECEPVSRENYRKFLRNGTVLKFLDDDAVEVMRPNGTIVRCLEFEKFRGPGDFEFERDGELTKDGTRIATGFVVENEPLINDWTDEEFVRFFENVSHRGSSPSEGFRSSHVSDVTRSGSYRSTGRLSDGRTDRIGKLLDDAFVSVLMTCRMEHECYATVAYGATGQCCELSMPGGVVIGISREGLYDINVGMNIELRIRNDSLTFSSKFRENDRRRVSKSVYNFRQRESFDEYKSELLVTVDSLGETFKVFEDGRVARDENVRVIGKITSNSNHERQRLFAMKRDFTAHEYLHKSKRDEYEKKMNSDERSSVISVAIPDRAPDLEYRLFLKPLEPTNYSKMWLQTITEFKRTNRDRTDLSRSTYSTPYDWLFPFGRNGNGIRKNTWKFPMVESIQQGQPPVLTLMVFEEIAKTGKNVLVELHKAVARYWPTAINERRVYRTLSLENWNECSESKIVNWVRKLALGIESNISLEIYLNGVMENRPDVTDEKIDRAPDRVESDQRKTIETEEKRWYEKCLRDHIIPRYFDTIQGSCFLWVMACVEEALRLARQ